MFNGQFTVDKVARELAYFKTNKWNKSFERTYGWAWLLKLQEELLQLNSDWSETLRPLVDHVLSAWRDFQPKLVYPIRVGEHTNTAFGLSFAMDYCRYQAWDWAGHLIILKSSEMLAGTRVWRT